MPSSARCKAFYSLKERTESGLARFDLLLSLDGILETAFCPEICHYFRVVSVQKSTCRHLIDGISISMGCITCTLISNTALYGAGIWFSQFEPVCFNFISQLIRYHPGIVSTDIMCNTVHGQIFERWGSPKVDLQNHHIFLETPHGLTRERYTLSDVLAQQEALQISWFATTSQQTPGSGLTQEEISLCHVEITWPLSVMTVCFSLEVSEIGHQMMHITVPMISTFWTWNIWYGKKCMTTSQLWKGQTKRAWKQADIPLLLSTNQLQC